MSDQAYPPVITMFGLEYVPKAYYDAAVRERLTTEARLNQLCGNQAARIRELEGEAAWLKRMATDRTMLMRYWRRWQWERRRAFACKGWKELAKGWRDECHKARRERDAARAEVSRLTRERDEAKQEGNEWYLDYCKERAERVDENHELSARIRELEAEVSRWRKHSEKREEELDAYAAKALDLQSEVSCLTWERDEARSEADAFRTALESISRSGPVFDAKGTWAQRVCNTASAALYAHPRPAAKEE